MSAFALTGCSAHIGSSCTLSTDCSARGDRLCDTSQPGGYCTVFGCGNGSCPDHAACVTFAAALPGCAYNDYGAPQRTARTLCVEHCEHDSDCRTSEGYVCADPRAPPWSATILDDNQGQRVCLVAASVWDPGMGPADAAICTASVPRGVEGGTAAEAGDAGDGGATDAADGD